MSKVISLRTRRKQAGREAARREAVSSSARTGEGKAVRRARDEETASETAKLDGHRRERPDEEG